MINHVKIECKSKIKINKTCHRDRIANATVSCPSHKKYFADAAAADNTDAGGSTIALAGLRPGELKMPNTCICIRLLLELLKCHNMKFGHALNLWR